ncbi:MAG: hypothetical protein ACRCYY_15515 [Trueperaceae bacterium]
MVYQRLWFNLILLSILTIGLVACQPPATARATTASGGSNNAQSANPSASLSASPDRINPGESTTLVIDTEGTVIKTLDIAMQSNKPFVKDFVVPEGEDYKFTSPPLEQSTIFELTAKDENGNIVIQTTTTVYVRAGAASDETALPEETTTEETLTEDTTSPEETSTEDAPAEDTASSETTTETGTDETSIEATEPSTELEGTGTDSADAATSEASSEETLPDVPALEEGLPEGTIRVTNLEELQAATAEDSTATTLMVAGSITCDADPCVRLKAGQTLMGEDGAVLNADRSGDGNLTTVIELASDSSVQNLEISGPDIYTAINGVDAELTGTIVIRDVVVNGPTANAPFAIRETASSGTYTLSISNLTMNEINRSMAIANFGQLEITNSSFNLNISDNSRGLIFQTGGVGSVLLDNVTVSSTLASDNFIPVVFHHVGSEGTLGVTVSNTSVNFPDAAPDALANARSFIFEAATTTGQIAVQTSMSTGNTTEATAPYTVVYDVPEGANPALVILGYLQGSSGDDTAFPER